MPLHTPGEALDFFFSEYCVQRTFVDLVEGPGGMRRAAVLPPNSRTAAFRSGSVLVRDFASGRKSGARERAAHIGRSVAPEPPLLDHERLDICRVALEFAAAIDLLRVLGHVTLADATRVKHKVTRIVQMGVGLRRQWQAWADAPYLARPTTMLPSRHPP